MRWIVLILAAMAIGAGPATEPDVDFKITTPDLAQKVFAIEAKVDTWPDSVVSERGQIISGMPSDPRPMMLITLQAKSAADAIEAVLEAASIAGVELDFGATFSRCMVSINCPDGSACIVIPPLEAKAMSNAKPGQERKDADSAFLDATNWGPISELQKNERNFPGMACYDLEAEQVAFGYRSAKYKGEKSITMKIIP